MQRWIQALSLTAVAAASTMGLGGQDAQAPTMKIGTYDNRAIAIAYAPSKYNPVREKMAEMEAAKQAGDDARVAELEAWGQAHQRQLHRQGFGHVPVNDLLAHVRDQLSEVARTAGVQAIAMDCDWVAPGAETVDVTDALVALFEPSDKVLQWVADMRDKEPLDLDEIEGHQDDH